jgi:ATP-binding cassette, subfamily B, multidrug efflux pump
MARNSVNADEDLGKQTYIGIILRLLSYLRPFWHKVTIVLFLMIFVMICTVINPYLLKVCIDNYIVKSNFNGLLIMAFVMIVYNFVAMLASTLRMNMMAGVTNTILINIRQELYSHIQKLTFSFFDNRPVGKILARVMGDVNSLQELFNNSITSLIPEVLNLVFVAIIMFYINLNLALASLILLPFLIVVIFSIEGISRKRWQVYRQKRSNFNGFTHESFSGIKIIQSFAVEKNKALFFNDLVTKMMDGFMSAIKLNDLFWPVVELSWGVGTLVVYYFGTKLIKANDTSLTIGTLVAFTSYVGMFWRPIINLTQFYNTLITNFAAAERIFEILDLTPDINDNKDSEIMPKIKGAIEFKDVTFGYEDGTIVLDNVNLKIHPGQTIAFVGPTGAGKTTIVNLISRFYDTQSGEILIDGKNVKNVELDSLRSQMGIMLQDTFLFSTNIKENIRYGRLNATDDEVIAAAKSVSAHEFIMKLEKGYETEVNERGSRLSVGQRQLISFARALLANPRILILDEATSNIDTNTEKLVQMGIEKLLHGRTSIVIAHRLSTIRDCNRIIAIDGGKIVETGSHDELIAQKGIYYDLYMSQYKFINEGA